MASIPSLLTLAQQQGIRFVDAAEPERGECIASDGVRLSYLDWGGAGEPVVFLHGGALTAHSWDMACLGLRDQYRCIALDLRGHGDSGWAEEYRIEASVQDLATLATHLQLSCFHLVGMSLGGTIAAHYAALYPAQASSLTLVDVGPEVDFRATQPVRDFVADTVDVGSIEEALAAALAVNARADRDTVAYRLKHSMRQMPDGRFRWKQDQRRPHDYEHILGKLAEVASIATRVSCPVLVVRGGRSRIFSDASAASCAALFAHGEWACVPDAGHNVQEDNPAALIEALRRFL